AVATPPLGPTSNPAALDRVLESRGDSCAKLVSMTVGNRPSWLCLLGVALVLVLAGCQGMTGITAGPTPTPGNPSPTPTPNASPPPPPTPIPTPTPTPTPVPTLQTSINHVIIMLQENRSFDSYFGKMTAYRAANGIAGTVDDLDSGTYQNSGIAPYHSGSVCMENLSPDWAEDR